MAVGTQADQRAWLRRAVGHETDTALVSDDLLDDALEAALVEVNRHWPLKTVSSFETVDGTQTYSILPAGAYRVLEVYYPVTACADAWWNDEFIPTVQPLLADVDEQGFMFPVEPALAAAYYRFEGYLRKFANNGVHIYPPGTVRLMPVPSSAETVYFLYSTARYATVEDVADEHERPYRAYAQFQLHNVLSTGRGALYEVRSPLGVTVRTQASIRHREAADRWEARFQGMLRPLRTSRNSP